jgi:hypothetical protein
LPRGLTGCTFRSPFWKVSRLRPVALDWIRRRQRALARGVLALFCLVWLQAALVPCAMALVPGAASDAPVEHCSYCPPTAETDDTGAPGGCAYPDAPQVDTRNAPAAPPLVAVPVASFVLDVAAPATSSVSVDDRPPARTGPPLPVSYCRFLK